MLTLLTLLSASSAQAADPVLAVLPFEVHAPGDGEGYDYLGRATSDMLVTDLHRGPGVRLVERVQLDAVVDELALQRSDFVDPSTAQRVGKGVGATALVIGSLTVTGQELRLDARLVDVGTGETLLSDQATGDLEHYFALERKLALRLLRRLGVPLDAETVSALQTGESAPVRRAPPTQGPTTTISLHKRVWDGTVFVDGRRVGEHARKKPLSKIELVEGTHELALSHDVNGVALYCVGVLNVGTEPILFKNVRKLCGALDPEAEPPWTSVRKSTQIVIRGDEAGWAELTVAGIERAPAITVVNVAPGRIPVLFSNSAFGVADWTCSGNFDIEPGMRAPVYITSGGCHGFHQPGVLPTEGPATWSSRIAAEQRAAREAERAEREAKRAGE